MTRTKTIKESFSSAVSLAFLEHTREDGSHTYDICATYEGIGGVTFQATDKKHAETLYSEMEKCDDIY